MAPGDMEDRTLEDIEALALIAIAATGNRPDSKAIRATGNRVLAWVRSVHLANEAFGHDSQPPRLPSDTEQ